MQRWEYHFVEDYGRHIVPASHRLQQVHQYLKSFLPHLVPKGIKIADSRIQNTGISLVDLMNVLGADGWEVVGVAAPATSATTYALERPTG